MPMFMDIHEIGGPITKEEVEKAHRQDVEIQNKYGVCYHKYWVNEKEGKIFCFVEAPTAEAAICVHRESHGQVANNVIEVQPGVADLFLGGTETTAEGASLAPGTRDTRDPGIRTILFTDIVGSTAYTQAMGDDAAMEMLRLHNEIVRDALATHQGREVKHTGDGIMASFFSSAGALRCAAQIHQVLAEQQEKEKRGRTIAVRIGAAAGEPVEHHNDLFGCTVQLAARLCAHADAEEVVVSNAIADLCLGKGFQFRDLGTVELKGFETPVRAHALEWQK